MQIAEEQNPISRSQKANAVFNATAYVVRNMINKLAGFNNEAVEVDPPMILKDSAGKTIKISCKLVDETFVTCDQLTRLESEISCPETMKMIKESIGFYLYAAKVVFTCLANTHKDISIASNELPFTLQNVGLAVDEDKANLYPVYVSDDQKIKIQLEHCIDVLLKTRSQQDTAEKMEEWTNNWKITHEKLEENAKKINSRADLEKQFDETLHKLGGDIGIIVEYNADASLIS